MDGYKAEGERKWGERLREQELSHIQNFTLERLQGDLIGSK